MRTFHIGGAAQLNEQSNLEAVSDGTVEFRDLPTIRTAARRRIALARNGEVAILDMDGRERATHRIPYGAHLLCADGHIVSKGDRIAEWDPFTMPIITEKGGVVKYQDLIEGKTLTEQTDEATGIAQRVVTENRATTKAKEDLRPRITLLDERVRRGRALHAGAGRDALGRGRPDVQAGDVLARVAARRPRPATSPAVCRGWRSCSRRASPRKMRSSRRSLAGSCSARTIRPSARSASSPRMAARSVEYLVPKSKVIDVQEGDYVKRGDNLIGGSPDPHDILEVLGIEPLAEYLVSEIQEVYRLQGVKINDKHIETIVRQMLQKVEITDERRHHAC